MPLKVDIFHFKDLAGVPCAIGYNVDSSTFMPCPDGVVLQVSDGPALVLQRDTFHAIIQWFQDQEAIANGASAE